MPSFCGYRNCHNLASSTYSGYCNQYHYDRARILELKEQIKSIEKREEIPSTSCVKDSALKSAPSQKSLISQMTEESPKKSQDSGLQSQESVQ